MTFGAIKLCNTLNNIFYKEMLKYICKKLIKKEFIKEKFYLIKDKIMLKLCFLKVLLFPLDLAINKKPMKKLKPKLNLKKSDYGTQILIYKELKETSEEKKSNS